MRKATIVALLGVLLTGCMAPSGGGSPSDFQERAGRFLDVAVPALDAFVDAEMAKPDPDLDRVESFALARAALRGLRDVATAGASIATLRDLAPQLAVVLRARGDDPEEVAGKVSIYLLTLAALDAALAPV